FLAACLFLVGCGSGGAGSAPSWNGALNSSGYPDVAGTYAMVFSASTMTCNNGNSSPTPALSENCTISQNGNILTDSSCSAPIAAGITVQSSSAPTGDIGIDGVAILNGSEVLTSSAVTGNIYVSSNATFTFSSNGASGTIKDAITYPNSTACNATINFTATKM
ncbi:MAG: hypothetical protein KGJ13_12215, partial [Patescibacteria group bacterium]|nr:hypothetical protein [Patescibacteria group bacterium]